MSKELYTAHVFNPMHNFGGLTFAIAPVRNKNNEVLYLKVGVAICATNENFNRALGKQVSEENLAKLEGAINVCQRQHGYANVKLDKDAHVFDTNKSGFITGFTMNVEDIAKIFWEDIHATMAEVYSDSFGFRIEGTRLMDGFNFRSYTMRNMLVYFYLIQTAKNKLRVPPYLEKDSEWMGSNVSETQVVHPNACNSCSCGCH